jgi:hypothetical protein
MWWNWSRCDQQRRSCGGTGRAATSSAVHVVELVALRPVAPRPAAQSPARDRRGIKRLPAPPAGRGRSCRSATTPTIVRESELRAKPPGRSWPVARRRVPRPAKGRFQNPILTRSGFGRLNGGRAFLRPIGSWGKSLRFFLQRLQVPARLVVRLLHTNLRLRKAKKGGDGCMRF